MKSLLIVHEGSNIDPLSSPKKEISTSRPLELIHIDLCGPMRTRSLNHSRYVLVIVDDYSRFTWTLFLKSKEDTFEEFQALMKKTQRKLGL